MRIVLKNLPQIEALSKPLLDALKGLRSSVAAWADKEHKADGTHDAVTATSLTVSGITTLGRVVYNSVTYVDAGGGGGIVNDLTVAGLSSVAVLRIVGESSPLQITGIDATGRKRGEILYVLNCDYVLDPQDVWLMMENTGSVATNRFAETTASPTSAGGPVIIQGGRGVKLMYDFQENEVNVNPIGARWRVLEASV